MVLKHAIVIDGGFATQLAVHVGTRVDGDPLWSARFNATDPNAVIDTHIDFLEAGANAILTNTYQASVDGYIEYLGLNKIQSIELIKTTVKLAHKARDKYLIGKNIKNEEKPWIVGSIGPYGAHLHDGSEYTGSYADIITPDEIKQWHKTRIDAILDVGVDALAIETIPCQVEADALIDLIHDEYPDVKFWISFQCKDGTCIAHGEKFADAALNIWIKVNERKMNNFLAVGVNCLHPKYVSQLFKSLNGDKPISEHIPLVVYPNSGEVYDVKHGWNGKEDCIPLESYVPEWINLGAKIIGGCCRTYARDITRIKETVENFYRK